MQQIKENFPDQEVNEPGYLNVFSALSTIECKQSSYSLYVIWANDKWAGDYLKASYIDMQEYDELDSNPITYSLLGCPDWQLIAGMQVKYGDKVSLSSAIAAVLFEMTFLGWSEKGIIKNTEFIFKH